MIEIQGPNPSTALNPTRNHALRVIPLAETLLAHLKLSPLDADSAHHRIVQSKHGANSYGLYLADGRQFHFRGETHGAHLDTIAVYDRWTYKRDGVAPITLLRTRKDCRDFVRRISNPWSRRRTVVNP